MRLDLASTPNTEELLREASRIQQTLSVLLEEVRALLRKNQRLTEELRRRSESTALTHRLLFTVSPNQDQVL